MIENWSENGSVKSLSESRRKIASTNLKACPLCDALNAASNKECFVCRWHGAFDHNPAVIERGLMNLLDRCPDFDSFEVPKESAPRTPYLKSLLLRLFHKKIDFRV